MDESESGGGGWSVTISDAEPILNDCHDGDSISINGTCLTVTSFNKSSFKVGLAPETLRRTNLGQLKVNAKVNLERAVLPHTRLGGHFVQGHVDTTATVVSRTPDENSLWFKLAPKDKSYMRYIVPKGFIALDGTSLTVVEVNDAEGWFTIMLISYTQSHVVLPHRQEGDTINIEVDMVGKYVEKQVDALLRQDNGQPSAYIESLVRKAVANVST